MRARYPLLLAAGLLAFAHLAAAQSDSEQATISLSFQTIRTEKAYQGDSGIILPDSSSEGYVALLELEYALSDHWQLYLGVPFVEKRFTGFPPHNPAFLNPPHPEAEFIDDGDTHGGLQDWRAGIGYRIFADQGEARPFVRVEIPSRNYPHFGSAAIGQNLWRVEVGADWQHQLEFSNFYYGAGYSYTFVEETLGVNVDYHRLPLRAGYFVKPRWSVELFSELKVGKGRDPLDYGCGLYRPDGSCVHPRFDDNWYQHDRQLRHEFATLGLGTTVALGPSDSLTISSWKMVWGRSINRLSLALDLTYSRRF